MYEVYNVLQCAAITKRFYYIEFVPFQFHVFVCVRCDFEWLVLATADCQSGSVLIGDTEKMSKYVHTTYNDTRIYI